MATRVQVDPGSPTGNDGSQDGSLRRAGTSQKMGNHQTEEITTFAQLAEGGDSYVLSDTLPFMAFIGVAVVANMAVLGAETDLKCYSGHCEGTTIWSIFDIVFTCAFVFDVGVAIYSHGPKEYFKGDPLFYTAGFDAFHCLDFFLVCCRVLDLVLGLGGIVSYLKFVSAFRIVHLGRFCKRIASATFRELWTVLGEMSGAVKAVGWVAAMLLLIMWVFAIIITIVVGKGDARDYNFSQAAWSKDDYWGTVPRSLYSLFQVLTRDKWSDTLVGPLIERHNWLVIFFVPFLCVAVLALLNTIVGVVVENTLSSAQANEEKEGKEKRKLDAKVMASLKLVFEEADADGSGDLSREELQDAMKKPIVRQRMKLLEIPLGDLDLLFTLLDEDKSGSIKTDMFFRGCSKLRGPAMSVDLHHMSMDLDHHIHNSAQHIEQMDRVCDKLTRLLDNMDTMDLEILRDEADEKDPVLVARRQRLLKQNQNNFVRNSKTHFTMNGNEREPSKSLVKASLRAASKPDARPPSKSISEDDTMVRKNSQRKGTKLSSADMSSFPRQTSGGAALKQMGKLPNRQTFQWPS
mmetsp:Transcript_73866/g.190637  ORF Transcript_73866/g.190637 Transcript_73866/m.190637 type:complete len:575 (+) Transcript_73866:111-1835(+)